jgi:hypothetical protein
MTAKRTVTYDNRTYKVRKDSIAIPDLGAMERMAALIWLNQETYTAGAGTRSRPVNLTGLGDAISVIVR